MTAESDLPAQLAELILVLGPWMVALFAFLETSFLTGLLVPAGPVLITAVTLAGEGLLDLRLVVVGALAGAVLGDSVGYWVGRHGGGRVARARGRLGSIARRAEPRARRLFHRHPVYSVTAARLLSFVRTLMPPAAGLGELSYSRFLFWDLIGVGLWAAAYVGIGLAADGSWDILRGILGTGGAVLAGVLGIVAWWVLRRRGGRRERIRE
jgi:membrane-associated protein